MLNVHTLATKLLQRIRCDFKMLYIFTNWIIWKMFGHITKSSYNNKLNTVNKFLLQIISVDIFSCLTLRCRIYITENILKGSLYTYFSIEQLYICTAISVNS